VGSAKRGFPAGGLPGKIKSARSGRPREKRFPLTSLSFSTKSLFNRLIGDLLFRFVFANIDPGPLKNLLKAVFDYLSKRPELIP
jgi:hypothetical protein